MTYEITFDNNSVEKFFMNLWHGFEWTERHFEDGDKERNIRNAVSFSCTLKSLLFFGADTECGIYNDNGFDRVGFARINDHTFIKNGKPNYKALNDALWEIAHHEAE